MEATCCPAEVGAPETVCKGVEVPGPRVALTLLQCWHRIPGGTARAALELASGLAARDDLDVVGVGPAGRGMPKPPWTPPVPVARLPLPLRPLYDSWALTGRPRPDRWAARSGPIDLVHATTTMVPLTRAPLVVSVYDLFPLTMPDQLTRRGVRLMSAGIGRARREARIIVVPSEVTAAACVAHGFDPAKVLVVPLGVRGGPVPDAQVAATRRRYGLARPYVLFVGTVEPRKNLPTLLRAFDAADLDGHDLVVAGPQGWSEDLEATARPLGERLHRVGFVEPDHLEGLYGGADLVCCPSRQEGFGLPALEAMVRGVPVAASAGTSLAEVVGDAGWLVDPDDTSAWRAMLTDVLGDDAARQEASRAGIVRARGFTVEAMVEGTTDAYRQAIR